MQINFPARSQAINSAKRRAKQCQQKQPIKISQKYINNNWLEATAKGNRKSKNIPHAKGGIKKGAWHGRGGAGLKYSKHLAILANELFMRNRKRSSVAEARS